MNSNEWIVSKKITENVSHNLTVGPMPKWLQKNFKNNKSQPSCVLLGVFKNNY